MVYFWLFEGPCGGRAFNEQTGPILLSLYPLTHIYVHVKQSDKYFLSSNPKYEEIKLGGPGGPLRRTKFSGQ